MAENRGPYAQDPCHSVLAAGQEGPNETEPVGESQAGLHRLVPPEQETANGVDHGRGVYAAALASLPAAGARVLEPLLDAATPAEAWERVSAGRAPDPEVRELWRAHAATFDLAAASRTLDELDVRVNVKSDTDYPRRLRDDISPPAVLFRRGRVPDPVAPAVAIVGTRRCTPTGRSVAMELGAGLAEAGVTVVSGLALGIDGAAHRGALTVDAAPVVGIVGSGIDVIYPRGNAELWESVAAAGTLLTEAPLGAAPEGWRFPARNRLLAGMADVVVVVESKLAGGSMHTVTEALKRGTTVMAVPGSVRNPAAAGANSLLSDGCAPACCVDDVLVALGLATEGRVFGELPASEPATLAEPIPLPDPLQRQVLAVIDDGPVSLDRVVGQVDTAAPEVLAAIEQLETLGLLAREGGRVMRA